MTHIHHGLTLIHVKYLTTGDGAQTIENLCFVLIAMKISGKISLKFSVLILANCQLVVDRRRRLRGGRKRLPSGASLNSCLHSGSFVILYYYTRPTTENCDARSKTTENADKRTGC